jgi:hypothetical protein
VRWEQPGRRQGEREQYRGVSVGCPYRWKTGAGEGPEISLRLLVVESTPLAKAKAPRLAAAQQAASVRLAELPQQWPRRPFACEAEAHQAATLCLRELRLHQPQLTYTVSAEGVTAQRTTRGRPPKDALRPQRQVWRVIGQVHAATEAIRTRAQRECRCVLAPQDLSGAELLRVAKGQPAAELNFQWAKNPAAMAPIFLETPIRMAALGGAYRMALLVDTLVERRCAQPWWSLGNPGQTARRPARALRLAPSSTACATWPGSAWCGRGKCRGK